MRSWAILALSGWLAAVSLADAANPPFRLALADGSQWVAPGNFGARPSVFLFWDTECTPCLQELTHLSTLKRAFPAAVFVIVSLASRDDTRRVLDKIKVDPEVVRAQGPQDPTGLLARLGDPTGGLPFTAVFTGAGLPCLHGLGPLTQAGLLHANDACR